MWKYEIIDWYKSKVLKRWSHWHIEMVDTKTVTANIIDQVYTIEQDLWARYLWEYMHCPCCSRIYSKEDVLGEAEMSELWISLKKNTVSEIEHFLGIWDSARCDTCDTPLEAIFWEEYKDEIASRYDFDTSFLMIHKSTQGRTLWFVDAYISDFDEIYERELSHYYGQWLKKEVRERVETALRRSLPEKFICLSWVGNTPDTATMKNLYELEKTMVEEVSKSYPDIVWIYESVIWSCAHMILEICKAQRLWFSETWSKHSHNTIKTDIFVHDKMATEWVLGLWNTFRDFYKKNKKTISKLRN